MHKDNTEERHLILIEQAPILMKKVGFTYNQVIQKALTKEVRYYPYVGINFLDMVAPTIYTNNLVYNQISLIDAPKVLFSLARRSGGFFCIDYPLEAWNVLFQTKKNLYHELDIDFNNSYYRFCDANIVTVLPFAIPLHFRLL